MPERLRKLQTTLDELERELRSLDSVDQQTREMLEGAAAEIQVALDRRDASQIEPDSLIDRLSEETRRFETTHPTLSVIVGRVINALAQLGI